MGLRPTHRDESALLTARLIPNGLCNDFRRSVWACLQQLRKGAWLGAEDLSLVASLWLHPRYSMLTNTPLASSGTAPVDRGTSGCTGHIVFGAGIWLILIVLTIIVITVNRCTNLLVRSGLACRLD